MPLCFGSWNGCKTELTVFFYPFGNDDVSAHRPKAIPVTTCSNHPHDLKGFKIKQQQKPIEQHINCSHPN